MNNFDKFNIPKSIISSLNKLNITSPTPVQQETIPLALAGKDILASAQTGTGKTIAYLIPLLSRLLSTSYETALILAPTRELASQVKEAAIDLLGKRSPCKVALLIGGDSIYKQISQLKSAPRIIIGTPGRINDHLNRGTLRLNSTKFLVLDETDRMLDIGFSKEIEKIVADIPKDRQTLMFSATMPKTVASLANKYLTNPERISLVPKQKTSANVKQETVFIDGSKKFSTLLQELNDRQGSVIIFVKTKVGADILAKKLIEKKHKADAIHGDLRQRIREKVLANFRKEVSRIMVATDVAARGIDVPHVMHVINYDLPQCSEDYIHRIGRTGRAGKEGFAVTFISPEEKGKWRIMHRMINSEGNSGNNGKPNNNGNHERRKFQPRQNARKANSPQSFRNKRKTFKVLNEEK